MAVLIIYSSSPQTLEEKIWYIADEKKDAVWGGYGVADDPEVAIKEMELVKYVSAKYSRRMFLEIVISFDAYESQFLDAKRLEWIAVEVCKSFSHGFQVFYGIHFNNLTQKHIHFAINSVNCYSNIRKLDFDKSSLARMKYEISSILMKIGLKPVLMAESKELASRYIKLFSE